MDSVSFPISTFFPRSDYRKEVLGEKRLAPLWLIATGQSEEVVKKNIETNEKKGRDWKAPHPNCGVTPLHVAVWRQNPKLVKFLLEEKTCATDVADRLGFLPIHYAEAIGNAEITAMVREATKVDFVSHRDVWDQLMRQPEVSSGDMVYYSIDGDGNRRDGNRADFAAVTNGASFVPTIFFRNRSALLEGIARGLQDESSWVPRLRFGTEFLPKLIGEVPPLALRDDGEAGRGVVATEDLEPFVPIVIYAGEGVAEQERESGGEAGDYLLKPIEAHQYRNMGGMINEGFPNCVFEPICGPDGVSYPVVVPIRAIKAGEGLYLDYLEDHHIKRGRRVELNLDGVRTFLAEKGLKERCEKELLPLVERVRNEREAFPMELRKKSLRLMTEINYLINTPSMLIRLCLEKKISYSEAESLGRDPKFLPIFQRNVEKQALFGSFTEALKAFDELDKKQSWDVYGTLLEKFNGWMDRYNAETALMAFSFVGGQLQQQLGWDVSIPTQGVDMMVNMFEQGAEVFEITRGCIHQRRDVTPEGLERLRVIEKAVPQLEQIFLACYPPEVTERYPQLHAYMTERRAHQERAGNAPDFSRLSGMMRSIAPPGGMPPGAEAMLRDLEANPEAQQAIGQFLLAQAGRGMLPNFQ